MDPASLSAPHCWAKRTSSLTPARGLAWSIACGPPPQLTDSEHPGRLAPPASPGIAHQSPIRPDHHLWHHRQGRRQQLRQATQWVHGAVRLVPHRPLHPGNDHPEHGTRWQQGRGQGPRWGCDPSMQAGDQAGDTCSRSGCRHPPPRLVAECTLGWTACCPPHPTCSVAAASSTAADSPLLSRCRLSACAACRPSMAPSSDCQQGSSKRSEQVSGLASPKGTLLSGGTAAERSRQRCNQNAAGNAQLRPPRH